MKTFRRCPSCSYKEPKHAYDCDLKALGKLDWVLPDDLNDREANELTKTGNRTFVSGIQDKQIARRQFLKKLALGGSLAGLFGAGYLVRESEAIPASSTNSTVEPGSMSAPATYVNYVDGSNYMARNGLTGVNDFKETNLQTFLNELLAGRWFFKNGTYTTPGSIASGSLLAVPADTELLGESREGVVFLNGLSAAYQYVIRGINAHHVALSNFTIKANRVMGTLGPIRFETSDDVLVDRLHVEGNASAGTFVITASCKRPTIQNCLKIDGGGAGVDTGGGFGFGSLNGGPGTVGGLMFNNKVYGGNDSALVADGWATGNKIIGNYVDRSGLSGVVGTCVEMDVTSATPNLDVSDGNEVASNTLIGTRSLVQGIRVNDNSSTLAATRVRIHHNFIQDTLRAVICNFSKGTIMDHNNILRTYQHAFALSNSIDCDIDSNSLIDVSDSTAPAGPYHGVLLDTGCTKNRVRGNKFRIYNSGGGTFNMDAGIWENASTVTNNEFYDNDVVDSSNARSAKVRNAGGTGSWDKNNKGHNPIGLLATPFDNTNNLVGWMGGGGSATLTSAKVYTCVQSPVDIYFAGGTVSAMAKNGSAIPYNSGYTFLHLEIDDTFSITFTVTPTTQLVFSW